MLKLGEGMRENKYRKWFGEKRAQHALEAFKNKGWTCYYAETLEEAKAILFETCLPKNVSVGLGGSETMSAMEILPVLRNGEYKLHDRYNCSDHFAVCRESLMAEYFLTGTNALTMTGEMVNLDEAIARVQAIAPMNCKRNNHETPCTETGICGDCNTPQRMCNHLLITLNARKFPERLTLILINEELGF